MFEPLQITAHLAGSIALARPEDLSLDGILAAQILRRHYGDEFYYLPDPKERMMFARLPLEMRGKPSPEIQRMETGDVWFDVKEQIQDKSLWYWSCSSAQINIRARDTHYWNKRFDTQPSLSDHIDFGGRVEKILIEQGRYKAYHMPLPTLVTEEIVWYASGDAEPIADLLQCVGALGKKRSYGNGAILSVDVQPIEQDWSEWHKNELIRPVPGPLFDQTQATPLDIQHIAYRAPQWHTNNQTWCVTKAVRHVTE